MSNDIDQWRKTQDSMLQEFDRLHPGRVWLRSWYTVDFPISRAHFDEPTVLWYHFLPPSLKSQSFGPHSDWHVRMEQIMSETRARYSRPPPKFRYVVCHYGQPFSWHWIEAAPTFGPMHYLKPYGPATGWQESVLFTTVGSSSGSFTAQGHSFRARSVHPGLFNTTASVPPAIIESAEYYSSASVEVEDFTGAGELTSFTQRSEQTLISHQSDEDCFEMYSSEEDDDEDSFAPVCRICQSSHPRCVPSRLTWRDWKPWEVLEEWWFRWRNIQKEINYRRFMGKVTADTSDSECDLPRPSTQDFQLDSASCSDDSFIADAYESYEIPKRYGSDCSSCSDDSLDSFGEDIWERNQTVSWKIEYEAQLNATRTRHPWRTACHITVAAADLDDTWELPSLAEPDCAGELELIRYTICTSAMAFEDSAAAAVSWERSLSLGSRLDRAHFASQMASVKDYWENRQSYLRRRHTTRAPWAKFSTKRGRRQHQQELRRARAHRKSHRTDILRPTQLAVQFRSPFPFAPPTALTIPLTASKGVFMFGAAARSNPSAQRPANLNTEHRPPVRDTGTRTVFTTQADRPKVQRDPGRCKQNGVIRSSDLLQPDNLSSPVDDSSVADSDHASAASTVPLLATLLSLIRGLRPDLPHRRRKVRSFKSSWSAPQLPTVETELGKHRRESRRHSPRCTRALMRALGRSRWLNGLCRGLHRGCTDGTGPRPSVEP